ncbi:histidine kinase [Psychroflexus sp. ALD_RP9]|uniref:tetratricopeptide repeat-containing sensor histidine kinase n=1 Tax=Psychroflexus sp. ALD_RP9 TaxID=2777186 RepID=UPI001A8F7301|nr:histidine kinase [Psychroflexus sp. ALD_RP9]QSS96257.1 histidine kinase [Psychroflexus sp. ALD_RP9]
MRLLFLLFCFSLTLQAQNDSLQKLIKQTNIKDTTYVNRLLLLSQTYNNTHIDSQVKVLQKAKKITKRKNFLQLEAKTNVELARAYRKQGIYDSAIANALNAKRIYDRLKLKPNQLLANCVLTTLYRDQKYYDKALELNKINLSLVKNDALSPSLGRYYFDLGTTYRALDSLKLAEFNYIKSLEIAKETGFKPGENFMKLSLGQLYKVMDKYDKAEAYLKEVLPVYTQQNNKANVALINYDLGTIASLRANHQASIPYYEKALKIYTELGRLQFIKDINQKLFIAYNIIQDVAKAKAANQQFIVYKDSIESQKRDALIAEMKTKFETDQIAAENKLNKKRAELAEAEGQRNLIFLIASIILILLLVAVFLFYSAKQKEAKKAALIKQELKASQQQLALEKQYRDSELKALKAQMNPHFIFNVLNSIQEFIVLNKKDLASEYLATFAELIRSYLFFSNRGSLTLEEEVDTLEKYLELEQLRFSQNFKYQILTDSIIDLDSIEIPTMIIQPYVENAIKHGLFHKKGDCNLNINFSLETQSVLKCIITDNGIGRAKAKVLNKKKSKLNQSFASQATASRLDLLNQKSFEKIGVKITDLIENNEPKGTKVSLTIPIKN